MYKILSAILLILIVLPAARAQDVPPPELVKVSVDIETGFTHILWLNNNDPLTSSFEVYKLTNYDGGKPNSELMDGSLRGTEEIEMEFVYEKKDAELSSIAFSVQATRPGSVKSKEKFDSTIFLTGNFDSCNASINLNWNEYNSWRGEVEYYGVYVSQDNGAWQLNQQLSDGATSTTISNVNENVDYRIFIATIRANERRDSSSSNLFRVQTTMTEIPGYIFGDNATYSNDGQKINFSAGNQGALGKYYLLKSNSVDEIFDTLTYFNNSKEFSYLDESNFTDGPYYYKMTGVNFCNVTMLESENIASTVVLQGSLTGEQVDLSWNNYETYNGQAISYTIERKYGNGEYASLSEVETANYTDFPKQVTDASSYSSRVYYRLRVMPGYINKYGNPGESLSNEIYFDLPAAVRFDFDAFIPGGDANGNDSFGPAMDILPENFWFRIFDANGFMVFESKDPDQKPRWNGRINGAYAREGVYAYILVYGSGNGSNNTITGNVTVAYP